MGVLQINQLFFKNMMYNDIQWEVVLKIRTY